MQPEAIKIEHTPNSRLIINGKDCEEWFAWTESFIAMKDLQLEEGLIMLMSLATIQAAMHDHDEGQPMAFTALGQMLMRFYQSTLQHIDSGGIERGEPLNAQTPKKDLN